MIVMVDIFIVFNLLLSQEVKITTFNSGRESLCMYGFLLETGDSLECVCVNASDMKRVRLVGCLVRIS